MKWSHRALETIAAAPEAGGAERAGTLEAARELARELEEALARAVGLDEVEDILSASAILLHGGAVRGELLLADREPLGAWRGGDAAGAGPVRALGVGGAGREFLAGARAEGRAGFSPGLFLLDVETSRSAEPPPEVIRCVLESGAGAEFEGIPRYGALLRSAYRSGGGREFAASLARPADPASAARISVHVVAGLEEPFVEVLPDLLFDLREALERGRRGRVALHLVSRRSPRLRGGIRETLVELERTKLFDDAFVVLSPLELEVARVARFIELAAIAPEILSDAPGPRPRGPFSSYGLAAVPALEGKPLEDVLSALDSAFRAAAPSWVPANAVLAEIAPERVFFVHRPESPPPEEAWRYCPELVPVPVAGAPPAICRVQRGLALGDLRLA